MDSHSSVWPLLVFTSPSFTADDSAFLHGMGVMPESRPEFRRDVCGGKHRANPLHVFFFFFELELIIGRVLLTALKVMSAMSHQIEPVPL